MLEELMSQYVDVDNKDFWDDSVSNISLLPSLDFTGKFPY